MIKYLLRLFLVVLVSTLGVGGGVGLLIFVIILMTKGDQQVARQYGLSGGAIAGLIFTVLFFCVMLPIDLLFRWSIARGSKSKQIDDILAIEQMRELVLHGSAKKIHYACRQALLSMPGIKNVYDDAAHSKISASTGTSWRCPGEVIEVEIHKQDAEQFLLCCVSRPAINKVIFDYGKNLENVELWKRRTQEFMNTNTTFG